MKYSHFIKLMKQVYEPDKEEIYNIIVSQKSKTWIKVLAIACAIVLVLGIAGVGTFYGITSIKRGTENHLPQELYDISPISAITATQTKGEAILPSTAFEITTKDVHSAKDIPDLLEISPKTEYSVKKTSGNTFNIVFTELLKDNTLYKLSSKLGKKTVYSWAFQTESKFEITASCGGKTGCAKMSQTQEIWVEFSRSDVKNFEQYFSINPAIPGTFEQYGKRWVFIPSSEFAKNTTYKVTISKDIICDDGQTLGNDYSFNIFSCVGPLYANCISSSYGGDRFTSAQTPTAVIEYKNVNISKATVNVYRSSSSAKYISIFNDYVKGGYISSAIAERFKEPGMTFEAILKTDPANNRAYLKYPEPLEQGFYIAQITMDDLVTYHLFEVSDYLVHASFANEKVTLWVNDAASQTPISGVTIVDQNGKVKSTDENGAVIMDHSSENPFACFNISTPTPSAKIVSIKKSSAAPSQSDIYSYMRCDKPVYKAGDTVKLFGFTHKYAYNEIDKYELKCSWSDDTVRVTPDSTGAFTCEFATDGVFVDKKGYIDLYYNGEIESTVYVDIHCNSPEYNIDITTDSNCYIEGETVSYTVYATLSDGTPAQNVAINFNNAVYTTNSRGIAQITETATANDTSTIVREFKAAEQSYFVDYTVFKSNSFITDIKQNNDGTLSVYVNTVDKKAPDFIGAPTECEVVAERYTVSYTQKGSNTYYDTLTLQQINDPVYSVNRALQSAEKVNTVNGVATIPITDTDSKTIYVIKVGGDSKTFYPYGELTDEFANTNTYLLQCSPEYTPSQEVTATLCKDSPDNIVTEGGKLFIAFTSGDEVKTDVFDVNNIKFVFDENFKTDVIVSCVYLVDGRLYDVTAPIINKKDNKLKVSLSYDKAEYAPGDTVNMNISVTGEDGHPVESTLNINVYDAKFYNESGYSNANNVYLPSPLFETVETDTAGNAKVSFTLDKNVAEWKVDVLAFDKNANNGRLVSNVKTTSAMFVDTFINDTVYVDDELSFSFRVNGTAIKEQYDYSAVLLKDGAQIATKSGVASVSQVKNESFGKLTENDIGKYAVKIICASGENSCEGEKEFELVKKSAAVTEITLQDNTDIEKNKYNSDITVNVYDAEYELYFKVIEKMLEKSSDRIDHVLANGVADSIISGKKADISDYVTDGGIYVYPARTKATYPQEALICTAANNMFDKTTVKGYFERALKGRPDTLNLIAINSVFATLGEPVLFELNSLYKDIESYTDEQKLFLAMAFANAGDFNRAYSILNDGLTGKILTANGVATFEADTPAQTEYMSCIAAVVTSKLSQASAKDLVKGLMNTDDSTLTGLAYSTFINNCVPYLDGKNTVVFKNADGKSEKITYQTNESVSFEIARKDIEKISIKSEDGNNFCCITSQNTVAESGYKKVEAKQSVVSVQNANITEGSTVKINMTVDTTDCKMKSPYAVFNIPHGLKLKNATVTSANGTVSDKKVYFSGATATIELECYAAADGEYTISAPTVIDKKSKQYIEGAAVTVKVS